MNTSPQPPASNPSQPLPRKKIPATLAQAIALHQQGKLDEAEALYKAILEVAPSEMDMLLNYSTLRVQRGDPAMAETLLKRLTATAPKLAYGHYAHGNVLHALKKYDAAADAYKKAIILDPKRTDFYHNEAVNYESMGKRDDAIASYQRVMATPNASPLSFFNCGVLLLRAGRREEAIKAFDTTIAKMPDYADAHINRTMALNGLYRYEEALEAGLHSLKLNPGSALAHNNRGNTLMALGHAMESLTHYDQAHQLDAEYVDPYWNRAMTHLALGNLPKGYAFYEWRWKTDAQKDQYQQFDQPLWKGEPLEGKTIYIYYEQGYGDFIQKLRFIPLLLERGARVLLETFSPLKPLIEYSMPHPNLTIITGQRPLPAFDYHCPVMSLPLAFGVTLDTLPNTVPYLKTTPEKITRWQQLLGPKTKPRIGLVWSGAAHHVNDANRSIPLDLLVPGLANLPYEFHSLQKEIREKDRQHLGPIIPHDTEIEDFLDTAALVSEMDLILSVDTSVAHLAGALAKPLWIMLPRYSVDYRWLLNREDSVWYPTARLFRQGLKEEWQSVISRVIEALPKQMKS